MGDIRAKSNPDDAKVKEIREAFAEDFKHWDPIYRDGELNMKFVAGDPWTSEDRKAREDAGRPVVSFDEIGQYLNLAQNEVRMNPRAPKFSPDGDGADEKTATVYGNLFRQREYRCNAQEAYTTSYDNALTRGFSFVRCKLEYEHPRSFYQQFTIEPVPNPGCCYPDSNSVRTDGSDWKRFTFIEKYTKADFEREFPEAEFTDFSVEQIARIGGQWMTENTCQVAEFWEVITKDVELIDFDVPATRTKPQRTVVWMHGDGPKPRGGRVVQERVTEVREVFSYLTNGVELLKKGGKKKHKYPGTMIPFAPCYGKMIWINQGSGPERKLISLVTLGREPVAAFCFLAACELEAIGTITKNPYWAYEGQLDMNLKNRVKQSLHEPVAVLEAKHRLEGMAADAILPLPQRNPMSVDLSAYALAKEGARRAIQAAFQGVPMLTPMQRDKQKLSGRALDRMEDQGSKGHYHYLDHYNDMLRRIGVIFEDVADKIIDVERELVTMEADKTLKRVMVGGWNGRGPMPQRPQELPKEVEFVPTLKGRHAVTVDIGPAFESERDKETTFLNDWITSPQFAAIEPPKRDKLLSLAIRQQLQGPMGQKMADIIDPQQKNEIDPGQALALLQQAQQQIIPTLEKEITELQQQLKAKTVEMQGRMAIEQGKAATQIQLKQMDVEQKTADTSADNETAITIQEMKNEIELLKIELQKLTAVTGQANEISEAEKNRAHEAAEGERGRAAAAAEGQANREAAERAAEEASDGEEE